MLTVLCHFWHDPKGIRNDTYVYSPEHVHRLKRQVGRGLAIPHEFVCMSDREIDGINTLPMDWSKFIHGTRFAKLALFNPAGPLLGKRALQLDLDTIVTGPLGPLVDRDEDLVLWRNPNFGMPWRARYNTSIILHTVGIRPEFYCNFNRDIWDEGDPEATLNGVRKITGFGGTDQALISHLASPNEAYWDDSHGVRGAGRLTRPDGSLDGVGTDLPEGTRIVFTPGKRTPWTPGFVEQHPWAANYE